MKLFNFRDHSRENLKILRVQLILFYFSNWLKATQNETAAK